MDRELLDGEEIFVIHDLLSPLECKELIARSERIGYEPAAIGGEQLPLLRNNGRAFLEDAGLAAELWRRAAPLIPAEMEDWVVWGLHEQFRFYRYQFAEEFKIHMDGATRRGETLWSQLTFMVYLSEVAAGGETNFYLPGGILQHSVRPAPGKALVFAHRRLHEGAAVREGCKYVLRTDVLYERSEPGEPEVV